MIDNAPSPAAPRRPQPAPATSCRPLRPQVFDFDDYRAFLGATIEYRKKRFKGYTRGKFAAALGFSSHSGLIMILKGRRDLNEPYLSRCIKNLNFDLSERLYFEALVKGAHMKSDQKSALLKDVAGFSNPWSPPIAREDDIRLLDFFLVQQILCLHHTFVSAEQVHSLFRYDISIHQVEKVLHWMSEKGYVNERNGHYKILKSVMMTKDEQPNACLRSMHTDGFALATEALHTDAIEDREFQTYVFTVDRRKIQDMKIRIKKMVLDIISEYETELDANTVVQMHFHLIEALQTQTGRRK